MVRIRKLLFPTDFSESAEVAWRYVLRFAEVFEAEVELLHVVPELPRQTDVYLRDFAREQYYNTATRHARRQIENFMAKASEYRVTMTSRVRFGVEALEIIEEAREAQTDLIMMGTHGRTGLARAIAGSVAEQVVRKASCPVLVVKQGIPA